jgi:RNA polymerase sigma-70 factor (ECF subfamily)
MELASSQIEARTRGVSSTTVTIEPGEQQLIRSAKRGDRQAFARLIATHQAVAFRAAYLVAGTEADAEDACQEACVKAWLALDRFRRGSPFRPWFVRIAVNEAHNRRRATGRRAGLALRLAETPAQTDSSGSGSPSAEAMALAAADRHRLLVALAQLREEDQLVIAARYFLGLSEGEAATALDLRRGTFKSRLSRGLGRLREQLEAEA